MASNPPGACCTQGVAHKGEISGKSLTVGDNIEAYLATPPDGKAHKDAAILYLMDALGLYDNCKLLADEYAAAGYTTLVVDLFRGDPLRLDEPGRPQQDIPEWIAQGSDGKSPHTQEQVDPIVLVGIQKLKEMGFTKIGAVGYCFGAKYLIRHYKDGIQVGFVAHPSFVDDEELAAITGPLSIAAAEIDPIFPAEKRHRSEDILIRTGQPWQINLFSGVAHGFAVREDLTVKHKRFAKEQAFVQAITWFNEHLL